MTPSVGDRVADRYELREAIGSGGFATVWRARDRELDRDVALKVADAGTHDGATVAERFDREAATLGRFEATVAPSSVVRYLDDNVSGPDDQTNPDGERTGGPQYIALEYLPGTPLNDAIGSGDLGESVRRRVVLDLAATIDFLHRNGVVYLDIRPENLIVRRSGQPVLIDFNTAASADEPVEIRFEPDQFKPPELLPDLVNEDESVPADAEPGPWSDVYAWGKLGFYLLTGVKVVPEDVPAAGLDPLSYGGTCSRELAGVVQRATKRDPDERYPDGMATAAAVARATDRGPRAVLTQSSTGVSCAVTDGGTMGRLSEDDPIPWVVLPDPERHVSPRHVRFEHTEAGWGIEDTSINGTYVGGPDDWTFLLSERGFDLRERRGDARRDTAPPSAMVLPDDAAIAPIHPEYGIELSLAPADDGAEVDDAGR